MLIERLIVRKTEPFEEIRNIKFNLKGLSLILDDTSKEKNKSGNGVGKTTTIKIIDLCLGANSVKELLYTDPDSKSENITIKNFLNSNKVQAELILLDPKSGRKYFVKRDLFNRGKRYINDVEFSKDEFNVELKKIIFNITEKKPTFRQLIPKFIRITNISEEGMIKFLPSTKNIDYDSIYCTLFKIYDKEIISKKNEFESELQECEKAIRFLEKNKNIGSLSVLKEELSLIEYELKKYRKDMENLSYIEKYKDELQEKRNISNNIDIINEQIELVEFEVSIIEDSIKKLSESKNNIDLEMLKKIYLEAESYIPNIQKDFEEVLNFHNSMIDNKINFIKEQLLQKEKYIESYKRDLDLLIKEKEKIITEVIDEGLLDELNLINNEIEKLSQRKGEISKSIELLEEQEEIKDSLNKKLEEIKIEMESESGGNKGLNEFNKIFGEYCERLYGVKYIFAYEPKWKEEKKFPVKISYLKKEDNEGDPGTGKKKGRIVAFDFAYMEYAIKKDIKAPRFVIHDKLESTHINQLKETFELCKIINGQYILPILRERINEIDESYIDECTVLKLSEDDKFFKI